MSEKTVLLVEDDPDDEALALAAFLRTHVPHNVIVAHEGSSALDYLLSRGPYAARRATELPALVLLDLKMPRVDGFEVLQEMRADPRTQYVPVVVFTSSDRDEDLRQAYALGANSYVRKPGGFEAYTLVVQAILNYWVELNQLPPAALSTPVLH